MVATAQPITLVKDTAPALPMGRSRTIGVARVADLPAGLKADLAELRMAALSCRSAARLDVFRACAALSMDREVAAGVAADALIRALPQALGLRPVLFRPGNDALSFDEAWLLRLIEAIRRGRSDDAAFLLASRVTAPMRRHVGFLARAVSRTDAGGNDVSV